MRIGLCDDEVVLRKQIVKLIRKFDTTALIDEYPDGTELLRSKKEYDVIFLDIEMPGPNGMDTAEKLREKGVCSHIIFLTSHVEYIYNAFKVKAFRFLKKDIDEESFFEALQSAEKEINNAKKIVVRKKDTIYEIDVRNVVSMEAFGDGTYIYDNNNAVYECSTQLKSFEDELVEYGFFRIHRSYLVSMAYVNSIVNSQVNMRGFKDPLMISRRKSQKFKDAYFQFIKDNARVL